MVKLCSKELTTRVDVGGDEIISRIADAWQRLCDHNGLPPFYWPQWFVTYVQVFEPHGQVVLLTAWAEDELVAVLPLVRKRGWHAGIPLVKLCGPANVHSVQFDIVRAQGPGGDAAIPALWKLLKRVPGWQVVELPTFPSGAACQDLIQYARDDGFHTVVSLRHNAPILRMQRDANGRFTWLADTSNHFRHELRRHTRLLESQMGGRPQLLRWAEPRPDLLRSFCELESSGWKGEAGSAIECTPQTRVFYERIARETARCGCFCLHSLELNGRMAAGAFSIMSGHRIFPLKIAYDESLYRAAPGHLLFNAIFEQCANNGVSEVYFGGNPDRFKRVWTSETLPHLNGAVFRPAFLATLAYWTKVNLLARLGGIRNRMWAKRV